MSTTRLLETQDWERNGERLTIEVHVDIDWLIKQSLVALTCAKGKKRQLANGAIVLKLTKRGALR